jgi:hypothetical protein
MKTKTKTKPKENKGKCECEVRNIVTDRPTKRGAALWQLPLTSDRGYCCSVCDQ